eukprot:COSAG05_NODE_877_length_6812_cov_6.263370_11_plen_76_part_00
MRALRLIYLYGHASCRFVAMKVHTRGKRLLPAQLRGNMKMRRLRLLQSMQGSTDFQNSSDDDVRLYVTEIYLHIM